jgi:hypothetical protein
VSTYDNQPPLLFSHEKHSTSYYTTTTTTTDNNNNSSSNNIVKPCTISNRLSSSSSSRSSDGSTRNKPFHDTVTNSIFYYMDKFVIITVKASIYMYTYTLQCDIDGDNSNNYSSNSIRRRNSSSSIYDDANKILNHDYYCGNYRLLHKWDLSSKTHNICAMACLNSTLSPYVFCSTTNK